VEATEYNYAHFDAYVQAGHDEVEFGAWPDLLHAGEPAPEVAGELLDDGQQLALSTVWKRRTTVVEFGSFT